MTAFNRNNIYSTITTLEGVTAQAILAYTAAYGGKEYSERDTLDVQRFSRYSISPVKSEENGTSLFLIARLAIPVQQDLLAAGTVAWLGTVEHSQQATLPPGYKAT